MKKRPEPRTEIGRTDDVYNNNTPPVLIILAFLAMVIGAGVYLLSEDVTWTNSTSDQQLANVILSVENKPSPTIDPEFQIPTTAVKDSEAEAKKEICMGLQRASKCLSPSFLGLEDACEFNRYTEKDWGIALRQCAASPGWTSKELCPATGPNQVVVNLPNEFEGYLIDDLRRFALVFNLTNLHYGCRLEDLNETETVEKVKSWYAKRAAFSLENERKARTQK